MNGSEFVFLAVGLILGVASGAALVEVLRARPPAPREVRLTVTPDAIPRRRGSTLAQDAFALVVPEPARGGPADHGSGEGGSGTPAFETRTAVRPGGAVLAVAAAPTAMVGFRVEPGRDPMFQAMAHASPDAAHAADPAPVAATVFARSAVSRSAVAVLEPEDDLMTQARSDGASGSDLGGAPQAPPDLDGPCGEARRVSVERCDLAARARAGVGVADETLRAAQRAYDAHVAKAEAAAAATDPASIRREKESAQARFRDARSNAGSPEAVEAAARDWLNAINRINVVVKEAGAEAASEHQAATAMVTTLERLALEADSARIKAEIAEEACVAAREAVAGCVEAEAAKSLAAQTPIGPGPGESGADTPGQATPGQRPAGPEPFETEGEPLSAALGAGQTPVIFLLLRGDSQAMARTVARLSDDPAEQRQWQSSLSELVDAIVAISISQSALDFPTDHPFWGQFTRDQDRDIVTALSSLGFRFDGLGGWLDERVPTQRDLSMAMGYAGLDPMRIRQWPDESGMQSLFASVTVTADEHLAGAAGDLTLGELVAMLGRRADGLARLWNDWGRVRPLLLEDA